MEFFKLSKKIKEKLLRTYQVIFFDARSMQERFSIKLNRYTVILFIFIISLFSIIITFLLIAYTPIKEYIPGYATDFVTQENKIKKLAYMSDSLSVELNNYKLYVENIDNILNGRIQKSDIRKTLPPLDSIPQLDSISRLNKISLKPTKRDSAFRVEIEKEDRWNFDIANQAEDLELVLFKPVDGIITDGFDANRKHFAIDIACRKGEPIKAVADGTVIFADWSLDTGYVIILFHSNNMMSIYKHNSQLYKQTGDLVKVGEVIAAAGSEGELSTGPHLHFELWINRTPVDPSNYLNF